MRRFATTGVFFVNGMALAMFFSSIPLLKEELALSDARLGTALGAQGVGTVIFVVIGSLVATKLGTRATMLIGALLYLITAQYLGLGASAAVIVPAIFALGATNSFIDVSMNAHASLVERGYGAEIMPSFHALYNFGGFGGAALTALLINLTQSLYLPLAVAGITQAVVVICLWRALGNLKPEEAPQPRAKRTGSRSIMRSKILFTLGVFVALALFVESGMNGWSGVYLSDVVLADASTAALAFGAFQLAMAIGRLLGAPSIRRLGVSRVITIGGVIGAIGVLVVVLFADEVPAIGGFALIGLGLANLTPMFFTRAAAAIPAAPALGIALVNTLGYGGFVCGPLFLGLLSEVAGLKIAFLLILVALLIIVLGSRLVVKIRPSAQIHGAQGDAEVRQT